jgi:hypothetical protein
MIVLAWWLLAASADTRVSMPSEQMARATTTAPANATVE